MRSFKNAKIELHVVNDRNDRTIAAGMNKLRLSVARCLRLYASMVRAASARFAVWKLCFERQPSGSVLTPEQFHCTAFGSHGTWLPVQHVLLPVLARRG